MKKLSPITQKFILHWGEMGTRWGVNRTVAQIHALLFLSPKSLNAEEISDTLGVARSNVSASVKELLSWGLIKIVHLPEDRRDHYESPKDVWLLFQTVLNERRRREVDPTLAVLRESVNALEPDKKEEAYTADRLKEMLEFFEATTAWFEEIRKLPPASVREVMKMGSQIGALFMGEVK